MNRRLGLPRRAAAVSSGDGLTASSLGVSLPISSRTCPARFGRDSVSTAATSSRCTAARSTPSLWSMPPPGPAPAAKTVTEGFRHRARSSTDANSRSQTVALPRGGFAIVTAGSALAALRGRYLNGLVTPRSSLS
jgi:hypothetical protein